MGTIYNPSKVLKLVPLILIIDEKSKQNKRMPQKAFVKITKALDSLFEVCFVRVILGVLIKFLVDPYY